MGRHKKTCIQCGKVQAVLDQELPVEPADCNDPNNATCRRNIRAYETGAAKRAKKAAKAGENKAMVPGADGLANLENMNTKELKAMCKELGLSGYSKMKKPALIDLIYQSSKATGAG